MYALAIVRYRKPLDEVIAPQDAHRAYLRQLKDAGVLIASGPLDPRSGGALLLRVPDADVCGSLDRIRDNDPYVRAGAVQYELLPWAVGIGKDDLDRVG